MNDTELNPMNLSTEQLIEAYADLEKKSERTIERLQSANQRAWQNVSVLEKSLAFMVEQYHDKSRMYDGLYERAINAVYACEEHQKEELEELERWVD